MQQKISAAQEVIRERARQRRENYDGHHQNLEYEIMNKLKYDEDTLEPQSCTDLHAIDRKSDEVCSSVKENVAIKDNILNSDPPGTAKTIITKGILSDVTMQSIDYKETNQPLENINCEDIAAVDKNDFAKDASTIIDYNESQTEDVTKIEYTDRIINVTDIENSTSNTEANTVPTKDFFINDRILLESEENDMSLVATVNIIDLESVQLQNNFEKDKLSSVVKWSGMSEISEETVTNEKKIYDEKENLSNVEVIQHKMDLETAAITIQKVFRNFLFKSKTTSLDDATNVDINLFVDENNLKVNIS